MNNKNTGVGGSTPNTFLDIKNKNKDKLMKRAVNKRTICEVLREINDWHQTNSKHDKRTRKLLLEAQVMAKKMSIKLLEYNKRVFKGWWEKNPDYEKDLRRRINSGYLEGE